MAALHVVHRAADVAMFPTSLSSSSSSSASSSSSSLTSSFAVSGSKTSPVVWSFFAAFLATSDLLSHTFAFLSFTDLFTASAVSHCIHAAADSDKVWRPRLSAALAISTLPTSTTEDTPTTPPPPTPPAASTTPLPSILAVLSTIDAYAARAANPHHNDWRHRPSPFARTIVTAIVATERPLVYHVKLCSERSPVQCLVDYREIEVAPVEAEEEEVVNGHGQRESEGGEDGVGELRWTVKRVGPRFSGQLVLNVADNRHLLTAPSPPPTPPLSAKQRYLATFGCSVRLSANLSASPILCRTLLPPQPPIPAPTVPPRWFSENLRDAVAQGVEPPPKPVSPFPALPVWPVCRGCRAAAAGAVRVICDEWRRMARTRPLQVDCVVRVNECEWDARLREYEDEMEYRRVVLTNHSVSTFIATSPFPITLSSFSTTSPTPQPHLTPTRLYQPDSGQYAITHPTNTAFTNPAPPSGAPRTHPAHTEHPLRYYRVSPYRHGGYVCNECAGNSVGEVWHCERCQFDLCMECAAVWPVGAEGEGVVAEEVEGKAEGEEEGEEEEGEEGKEGEEEVEGEEDDLGADILYRDADDLVFAHHAYRDRHVLLAEALAAEIDEPDEHDMFD